MGISDRKERERTELRTRILEAAIKLFVKEGFEKVTMRRIAEEVEYSPATLYLYFRNKTDILMALRNEGFEELIVRQEKALTAEDPLLRLKDHAGAYIGFALELPEFYDLMFMMRLPVAELPAKDESDAGMRSYSLLLENVKDCIKAGYFKGGDFETVGFVLWSLVHGMASLIIRQRLGHLPKESEGAIINGALELIGKLAT